jgi:prepilin-type N-terminal cleavage/methylation domain-containing protein
MNQTNSGKTERTNSILPLGKIENGITTLSGIAPRLGIAPRSGITTGSSITTRSGITQVDDHRISILKGLCPPAQGCEERATLGKSSKAQINPERVVTLRFRSPDKSRNPFSSCLATLGFEAKSRWDFWARPNFGNGAHGNVAHGNVAHGVTRHNRAFTLIELLVVIAVISILAALVIPVTGAVNAGKIKARTRAELAQIETAIERYKAKLGHYPPDNPPVDPAAKLHYEMNPNQLYYELMGTTNDGRFYRTLDGNASVDITSLGMLFGGPKIAGFVNSTRGGGGDEGGSAQRFFDAGLKPNQIGKTPSGAIILVGVPWQKGPAPFDFVPFNSTASPAPNPWRYNSSSPTHNPNSYDLWLDVVISSKAYRICNWSKQPLRITSPTP